jgi:hypothetical protein
MDTLQHAFPSLFVRQLCVLLGVSRSWRYQRPNRSSQAERDVALRDAIEHIVLVFPGYGYRRGTAALHRPRWEGTHQRVLRDAETERFFKTLKREEVYLNQYATYADAEARLGCFIDDVDNQKRLQSSLGCLPPMEYESLDNANEQHPSSVVR